MLITYDELQDLAADNSDHIFVTVTFQGIACLRIMISIKF